MTEEQIKNLKARCRIIFYPNDGAYPVEYTPFVKDAEFRWELLLQTLSESHAKD